MSEPGTPLPWLQHTEFSHHIIVGANTYDLGGECVAVAPGPNGKQDASYIREACNAYPHLLAALRKLVEQASYMTPCGDDLRYDCCDASIEKGHADHCTFAAAIAEAERLLGDAT